MPFLRIQTSAAVAEQTGQALLKKASRVTAEALGKPEQYMMVCLEAGRPLIFGGGTEPAAFVELKSIGLPARNTAALSAMLCSLIESDLGVSKSRVYINFSDVPGHLWGWNGATF